MARYELKYNHPKLKGRRQELRNNPTKAEILLWERLRKNQILGAKFRRQFSIDSYVVDFYCAEFKLAVEVDGITHQTAEEIESDLIRQKSLENVGLSFLRFTNADVFSNIDKVVEQIQEEIGELKLRNESLPQTGRI